MYIRQLPNVYILYTNMMIITFCKIGSLNLFLTHDAHTHRVIYVVLLLFKK